MSCKDLGDYHSEPTPAARQVRSNLPVNQPFLDSCLTMASVGWIKVFGNVKGSLVPFRMTREYLLVPMIVSCKKEY